MKAYAFHPVTGEYMGEVDRQPSPLEFGEYLLPANSTDVEPPAYKPGKVRVWTGSKWKHVAVEAPAPEPTLEPPVENPPAE